MLVRLSAVEERERLPEGGLRYRARRSIVRNFGQGAGRDFRHGVGVELGLVTRRPAGGDGLGPFSASVSAESILLPGPS